MNERTLNRPRDIEKRLLGEEELCDMEDRLYQEEHEVFDSE